MARQAALTTRVGLILSAPVSVRPRYSRLRASFRDVTDTLRRVIIAARFTPTIPRQATNEEILTVTTAWAKAA